MDVSTDWDGTPHWEQEPEVAEKYIRYIDPNVQSSKLNIERVPRTVTDKRGTELPDRAVAQDIIPHGASFWTRTAQIMTSQPDGTPMPFFLKVSIGDDGKGMMHGEYESMKCLNQALPELVPFPIAWGTYETDPGIHFFICTFYDMDEELCSLDTFPRLIAELHKQGISPNGKFGFPVTTYQGRLPQDPTWCDTWEECFSRNIDIIFEHEVKAQGPDDELAELRRTIMERVIPRLLRPMETDGRKVVPRLIHGDLWEGNAGTDLDTAIPKIFDACSWYAHNEFEMAPWRPLRQKMGKPYVKAYTEHFPVSEPVEDFDGRNALYALRRFNLCSSALYPGNLNYRNVVRTDLRDLVERYPETFEQWQENQGKKPNL
ncbi:Fructosamine/Ketosamine-3-kinase [Apiospora sp. TS-2023a]